MQGKDWVIMLGSAAVVGLGVYLGADVKLDSWADMNVPRLVLGACVAFIGHIVAFLAKSPKQ